MLGQGQMDLLLPCRTHHWLTLHLPMLVFTRYMFLQMGVTVQRLQPMLLFTQYLHRQLREVTPQFAKDKQLI